MNNPLWKIWNFHHTISILIKFLNNSKEDIYLSWITSKLAPTRPFLKRNKPPVISFIQAAASNLATIKSAQAHLHGKQNHSTTESRYHPPTGPARRPHHPRLSQPHPRAHSPPEFMQTSLLQGLLTQPRDSTIPSRPTKKKTYLRSSPHPGCHSFFIKVYRNGALPQNLVPKRCHFKPTPLLSTYPYGSHELQSFGLSIHPPWHAF